MSRVLISVLLCSAVYISAHGSASSDLLVARGGTILLVAEPSPAIEGGGRIIQELIDRRYPSRSIRVVVRPFATTDAADVLALRPQAVALLAGMGADDSAAARHCDELATHIIGDGRTRIVLGNVIVPGQKDNERSRAFSVMVKEMAAKYAVSYLPIYERSLKFTDGLPAQVRGIPGGVVSTTVGSWIVAESVLEALAFPLLIDPIKVDIPMADGPSLTFRVMLPQPVRFTVMDPAAATTPRTETTPEDPAKAGTYHVVQPPTGAIDLKRRLQLERQLELPVESLTEARVHQEAVTGRKMPYRLYRPAGGAQGLPLVLFLHHAGVKGTDNLSHIKADSTFGMFLLPENQARHPCVVVAPQVAPGSDWSSVDMGRPRGVRSPEPNDNMRLALAILDAVRQELRTDDARIYVTGTSMGGFGTWDAVSRRPAFFAAAVPTCGGHDEAAAALFLDTPIWALHGNDDEIIRVERSRRMVDAVRTAGGRIRYWEFDGLAHEGGRDLAYSTPEVLEWIFAQRRPPVVP